jgi:hypothetical protein
MIPSGTGKLESFLWKDSLVEFSSSHEHYAFQGS